MLLLCALVAGVSSAWAEDLTATITQSALGLTGSYTSNTEKTIDGITYVYTDLMKNGDNIQAKASSGVIYNKTAYAGDIKRVAITHSGTARATTIFGSADGTNWTQVITGNGSITGDFSGKGYRYFKITRGSNAAYWTQIVITYESGSSTPICVAPSFDPAAGAVLSGTKVSLSTTTEGATIYYTMGAEPSDPTTSSSVYSTPIEVTSATTIKAIAVRENYNNSSVASATYTIITPLANIAALTAETTTASYYVTLNNAVVTFVSGNYAYIQDASGAVVLYKSGHGLAAGDVFNGVATVSYQLKNNNPQITNISGVTPTSGEAPAPTAIAQSAWAYTFNDVLSQYLKITGATITQSNSKYYVSLGGENIQLYKSGGSISGLDLTKTYNITGFPTLYNSTKEIQIYSDPEEVSSPTLSVDPKTADSFTYVAGNGPSVNQKFTVTGSNLVSADITATVSSDYEITDDENYSSSVTIASSDVVYVRLKAGLAKGTHDGTLTFSSTDADDVVINLSGSVTGTTYDISVDDDVTGGTIEADLAKAEEGATVTLTATPDAAYTFGSWTVYEDDMTTEVPVTNNQFTMPACEVYVTATFNAKPTYAVTCVANPVAGGVLDASPASAYEGQTVTLSYVAETGYSLSSIVITKTSDGSATDITPVASGDDFTFTMPGYAVTATATFLNNTYEGTFALYSGDLTEGDYILVYNGTAMSNSVDNNKLVATNVVVSNNTISNPERSIVWHVAPSETDGYWTIYNAKVNQYVNGSSSSTNVNLVATPSDESSIWSVSRTYDFRCKANEGQSTARFLRKTTNFGNYASSNGGALSLYKYTTLTERTITFDGNGGTCNEGTTYTQTVYDGVMATLDANKFTRDGYEFLAWNTQDDGLGDSYLDGGDITVAGSDLTLYAQWAPLYTLTIDNNIEGGSVGIVGNLTSSVEGVDITLTATPAAGHKFSAWNVYKAGDPSTKVTVTDNKFEMPGYNVVISATFAAAQTYTLVTDINDLVPGKHYIIANGTNGSVKVMDEQSSNNRSSVEVTASNGIIPETDGIYEFVLYGPDASGYYTLYDETNAKYLYAASSSSNYLKTQETNNANGKWTIEIDNEGVATIKAQGNYTRNWMRNNGAIFSCYGSGQNDIYLYVKDGDTPVTTTVSVKLNAYGFATFASPNALDFLDAEDASFSAWQVTGITDSDVNFGQISSTIKAGTGILLKGTPDETINVNVLPTGGANISTTNKLEGITVATAVDDGTYFGLKGNVFKKVNAGTVPAGKALLPVSAIAVGTRELTFDFGGEATGVAEMRSQKEEVSGAIYNLNGQKVEKPGKGLYIMNGRKVMVK